MQFRAEKDIGKWHGAKTRQKWIDVGNLAKKDKEELGLRNKDIADSKKENRLHIMHYKMRH